LRTFTLKLAYALTALGLITLMLAPGSALSKRLFQTGSAEAIPYDEGDFGRIPTVAAEMHLADCRTAYKGAYFTFDMEVSERAWRPVYAIEVIPLNDVSVEVVECPPGWSAKTYPEALGDAAASFSFETTTDPIMPGTTMSGFKVLSNSNRAVLRWYATEKSGIMLGKVTRTVLTCASNTVPGTWGSVKAVYK
jgi:hypothetical protein